jgi:hypothetical protein
MAKLLRLGKFLPFMKEIEGMIVVGKPHNRTL